MNNVNMSGMNMAGGPVGGGMPLMNNGAPGARPQMLGNETQRSQLNTYIYDYFLRNNMYDCARSLYQTDASIKIIKDEEEDGEDAASKEDPEHKRPRDLPRSDVPSECPESCFLLEWWSLFWDMFNAQRGKGEGRTVLQYVNHTQAQSRLRQENQQNMLRGLRAGGEMIPGPQYQQMMRMQQQANGGMGGLNQNELRQKVIQNNNRIATPQQQMMMAQKQQAMQRDPSSDQQRAGSPGSVENAPSPSKRPRLDGGAQFNPQGQMPNGRGQQMPQQVGDSSPSNATQAAHMQLNNGVEPNLTAQQFQTMPGGQNPIAGYQQNLARQQAGQMPNKGMPNPGGPPSQGSPMMSQGQDGSATIAGYYNAGELNRNAASAMGGGQQQAAGGGNHALQDYQMQLMLLEQQNKKRLMMARQEQDNIAGPGQGREGVAPGMGPNGQPFSGTSPQGARSVNSPNPSEQMKRGTPHMNPAGIPSPVPEGQSRGSPGAMNFTLNGGQMDPGMNQQYFMKNGVGMDPNMAGGMSNGMRPPSSHPGAFNGQGMTPSQLQMAQQTQRQQAWQNGQNGQMMPGPNQGGPQPPMGQGTPLQRPMPPPAAPGATTNGRTPSSPQSNAAPPTPSQTNKAAPKKKTDAKDTKKRAATKKGGAPATGVTPSADSTQEPATPTPATPITPVHPKSFQQNGAVQPVNGQPPAPINNGGSLQPDPNSFIADGFFPDLEFNPNVNGNSDVLQDFDFDSFLHNDGDVNDSFDFSATFMDDNQIGAE